MLFVNSFQTVCACVKQLRESDSWCCLWCMATSPLREGGSTTWNATSAYSRGWKNWISSLELNLFPCFSFFFEMFLDDFHESWRNFDAKEFCQPVQDNSSHPCGNLCHWRIVVMTFEGQACCYQRETNLWKWWRARFVKTVELFCNGKIHPPCTNKLKTPTQKLC